MHVLRASGGDTLRQGQGLGRHVLEGIRMPRAPTAPWRESWCLQLQVVPLQITGLSLALLCCILNPDAKRRFLLLYQARPLHGLRSCIIPLSACHPWYQPQLPLS